MCLWHLLLSCSAMRKPFTKAQQRHLPQQPSDGLGPCLAAMSRHSLASAYHRGLWVRYGPHALARGPAHLARHARPGRPPKAKPLAGRDVRPNIATYNVAIKAGPTGRYSLTDLQ